MTTKFKNTKPLGLGDAWNLANFLLQKSQQHNKPVEIKTQNEEESNLLLLIQSLLQHDTKGFTVTKENFDTEWELTQDPYFKTKLTWDGGSKKTIITKVTSKSKLLGNLQDLPENEIKYLDELIKNNNYTRIELNNEQTIKEIIMLMSSATAFIGINTGMSHIAHSVGLPNVIIHHYTQIPLDKFHGKNKYLTFKTIRDFENFVNNVNPKT
jgi:ADP-heptose:LPS heptosyltransferase